MKNILCVSFIAVILLTRPSEAKSHHPYKTSQIGEYYEYDLEDHDKKITREFCFHTKQVLKTPFKAVSFCYRGGKSVIKKVRRSIELYLSDSRSIKGRRRELKKALSDWEGEMHFTNFYAKASKQDDTHCLYGLPQGAYKALKNILYTAGFRLPRATLRVVRDIIHGACDCLKG